MTNRRRPAHTVLTLVFIAGITTISAHAEEAVLHRFQSADPDPRLENILYLSAGVALVEAGYSSIRGNPGDSGVQARYLLATEYRVEGNTVTVTYDFRSMSGTEYSSTTLSAGLDVGLDQRIAEEIERLISAASLADVPSDDARIYGIGITEGNGSPTTTPAPAGTASVGATGGGEDTRRVPDKEAPTGRDRTTGGDDETGSVENASESSPSSNRSPSDEDTEPDAVRTVPESVVPEQTTSRPVSRRNTPWDVTIHGGGAFILGDAADLLQYGGGGRFSLGYTPHRNSPGISYRVNTEVYRYRTVPNVRGGALSIVSVAPAVDAILFSSEGAFFGIEGSAGVAVISVTTSEKLMAKSVPFLVVYMHGGLSVTRHLVAGFGIGWKSIFEGGMIIHEIMPSLSLSVPF